ncbi:MAG: SGNH/GDSL hydrolase family protein [Mycetocola sp.]
MPSSPFTRSRASVRWPVIAGTGLVLAGLVAGSAMLLGAAGTEHPAAGTAGAPTGTTASDAGPLSPGSDALFFGDSWTWGYSAEPPTAGMAYTAAAELELDATVDGVPGTGFVSPGPGNEGSFARRLTALDLDAVPELVVLQGGTNDTESTPENIAAALTATVDVVEKRWPEATLVVVGPGPRTWPAEQRLTAVDAVLSGTAADLGIDYISPLAERWITEATAPTVLDQSTSHPGTAGHAYLGRELADSIRELLG